MIEDDDADLNLAIPVKALLEEFVCPICFNRIEDCHITQCGHNFCKNCILECLNRKHQCPCCNKEATRERLVKNHHFDSLMKMVVEEKDTASKKYFENLLKKSGGGDGPALNIPNGGKPEAVGSKLSPIEELFHRHMKRALTAYEEYYRDLQGKWTKRKEKLQRKYAKKMSHHPDQKKALTREFETKAAELDTMFKESMDLLLQSYDKYMKDFAPVPKFLPVSVTLSIPSKNIRFPNVLIGPTDAVKHLREVLQEKLKAMGNPLVAYSPNAIWVLKRGMDRDEIILQDENRAIVAYKVDPGATIMLKGEVQLTADLPKQCFAATWEKGKKMDYFKCADCKLNWLCTPCVEACHKGHSLAPFLKDHVAEWACCYCSKNKKCTIQKK